MPGIGILSTLPYNVSPLGIALKTAFEQGLSSLSGITYNRSNVNLGYSISSLTNGLHNLINDTSVTLIVACGGLVSEMVAATSSKDYISLVGSPPAAPGTHFKGRVDLQSADSNHTRRIHLRDTHGIQFADQCILSNDFSAMSAKERLPTGGGTQWGHVRPIKVSEADADPAARQQKYVDAFNAIPGSIRAVIISADPYFNFTSHELVHAANNWVNAAPNRRVCYPLQEYGNAVPAPTPGRTCLCGPSLVEAYQYLGRLAANVIAPGGHRPSPGNLPQPCVDI
jgi:hypothetical protein